MITRPLQREPAAMIIRPKPANSVLEAGPIATYEPAWYRAMKVKPVQTASNLYLLNGDGRPVRDKGGYSV